MATVRDRPAARVGEVLGAHGRVADEGGLVDHLHGELEGAEGESQAARVEGHGGRTGNRHAVETPANRQRLAERVERIDEEVGVERIHARGRGHVDRADETIDVTDDALGIYLLEGPPEAAHLRVEGRAIDVKARVHRALEGADVREVQPQVPLEVSREQLGLGMRRHVGPTRLWTAVGRRTAIVVLVRQVREGVAKLMERDLDRRAVVAGDRAQGGVTGATVGSGIRQDRKSVV